MSSRSMALRLHPVGQGPMKAYVNKYDNTYNGNVDETVWEVNTNKFQNNLIKNQKQGYVEAENYPISERRSVAWANKRKLSNNLSNLSPIPYEITPNSVKTDPFTLNSSPNSVPNNVPNSVPNNVPNSVPNTPFKNKTKERRRKMNRKSKSKSRNNRKTPKTRKTRRKYRI